MLVTARRRVLRTGRGRIGLRTETVGVTTPTSWSKKISGSTSLSFMLNTSITQAKKLILVVKRLLCFLRSLSDSLIPWPEIQFQLILSPLSWYQPCVLVVWFLRNLKMAPYMAGTKSTKAKLTMFGKRRCGSQRGPWNSAPWNLTGVKKFDKLCLKEAIYFSGPLQIVRSPKDLFSVQAAKEGDAGTGGCHENAGGKGREKKWSLNKCPHLWSVMSARVENSVNNRAQTAQQNSTNNMYFATFCNMSQNSVNSKSCWQCIKQWSSNINSRWFHIPCHGASFYNIY